MGKAEAVAAKLAHLAPDRPLRYVVSAVRLIDQHRTVNPDPASIRAVLLKTLHESSPFTTIRFIEGAVENLASRS